MAGSNPRKWIVVVEDNARLRELWVQVLEQAGYAAVGSEDGLAAAELIRDVFPDLILLDLQLPRMSGWDFLEALRGHPHRAQIPILIVSGFLDDASRPVVESGLNIVGKLAKPVTFPEVLAKIEAVFGAPLPGLPRPSSSGKAVG